MASNAEAPRRGGWYYGWNVVAVCVLSQVAANGLTYNAFSLFLNDWSHELHTPISKLQLTIAGMILTASITSPLVGAFSDKYPPRRLFAVGLTGMAAFYLAMSFVTSSWHVIALYALLAPLFLGLCTAIPANAVISRWFVRSRGLALGLSAFGIGMAGVLLPPIIAAVLPQIGWRMVWRIGAALLVFVVMPVVVLVIRPRPTEREGFHYLEGEASGHAHHGHGGASSLTIRQILSRRNFWLLLAIYLPILSLQAGVTQNAAPFAASHGFSRETASLLISVISLSHIVATVLLGLASDRFGNRLPFAGLAVIAAAGAVILSFSQGLPLIVAGCALAGFGGGLFTLLAAALAVEFGADGFGRAYGCAMAALPLGSLVPFFVAKTQESTGSYAPALLTLAAITLAAGGLILLLREKRGGHPTAGEKDAALDEAIAPIP
jgi:MFS family permease